MSPSRRPGNAPWVMAARAGRVGSPHGRWRPTIAPYRNDGARNASACNWGSENSVQIHFSILHLHKIERILLSLTNEWNKTMIQRDIEKTAKKLWKQYPVLTVTGPRQSGKTTLVRSAFSSLDYVNLEEPDVREEAVRDARGFLSRHPAPAIFDEIQNTPQLVSYIQAEVDRTGGNGRYVLTGSHQPALQAVVSQSLAGRTALLELFPLSVGELAKADIRKERDALLFDGFMPRLYSGGPDAPRLYSDYFKTYVERDIRQLSNVRDLRTFERFIRLVAGRVGQLLNIASLADDAGISATAASNWLSLLEASYIIRFLHPYYRNFGKRFVKAPKLFFVETGLVCHLLGIKSRDQIASHPLVGNLFENMVVMEAFKQRLNRGENPDFWFLRTSHGVEADLASENAGKLDIWEIKSGATFHDDMADNLRVLTRLLPGSIGRAAVVYAGRATSGSGGIPVESFVHATF